MSHAANSVKQMTVEAKIIRADGTVEELGQIAEWHRNPLVRAWWKLKRLIKQVNA